MPKFERSIVSTSYCVELAVGEMVDLIKTEKYDDDENLVENLSLIEGVSDVDWNGHFGPIIYLTLELGNDTPWTWEEIYNCIDYHITKEIT